MKQTWRWFGPADSISIDALLQVGVEGVVSALHHVPPGTVWTPEEIALRQRQIAHLADGRPSGLAWDVVESLPVSETIKTKGPEFGAHIDAYKQSLHALAEAGIEVICYNFMPVLDWTRTILRAPQPHGGTAMHFDLVDFAAFDLHILQRAGAAEDYADDIQEAAKARAAAMDDAAKLALQRNITMGLPGTDVSWTLDEVRACLARYDAITPEGLRANLIDFLSEVVPTAERLGLRMCAHPDDPPFPLLGLPRILSGETDYARVLEAVDSPASGVTFCTGSLGVAADFDPVGFLERLGPKVHFVHLRNTMRVAPADARRTSFFEAAHLEGNTDMVATIRALLSEEGRRRAEGRADWQIPMRPDHGQELLDDLKRESAPGYPLIGRMRGLAELRGVMAALAG